MPALRMLFIPFLLLLHTDGKRAHFVTMNENSRDECTNDLHTTIQMKSIGILYKDEAGFRFNDFLKSIADCGISSSIFEFSVTDFTDLINTILSWKSFGIQHVLFLQALDTKLIYLWTQILTMICDETWWLFYAEEDSQNLMQAALENSNCVTDRWIVFSTNFSSCLKYDALLSSNWYTNIFENSSRASTCFEDKISGNLSKNQKSSRNVIRLAVNESPPYLTLNTSENGDVILVNGPDAELLKTISEKFGFEYQILMSPDGEWGNNRRGNWTGLIGMLSRGEADIASGCMSITYHRYLSAGFSFPYDIQRSVIISRIPSVKPKTYAVLLPFTRDVWLMVLFIMVSFLFLLYIVGKIYENFYSRKPYKLDRIFWYMIGSACSEGGWLTFAIQGAASVLLLGLWFIFVLVMQTSYTGTLMSVLTFPAYENSIDTLSDLAKAVVEESYKCGCLKGTLNCDTLMDMKGDLKPIADSINSDKKNFVRSVHEGLDKVLDGKFAFLAQEIGSIYHAQLMSDPYFHMSDEGLDIELFSLAARNGFPYLKEIDNMILKLLEAGLIAKWRDDIISMNNMKFDTRRYEVPRINPLSLKQLTGAIYMLFYGALLAVFALIYECISGKCFNKSTR